MSFESNRLYMFKDFRLDVGETTLERSGQQVLITPKAFEMLRILVERHGTVVRKKTLMDELWADSFVEEGNLAFTARMLRKVLGDDAKTPTFIETVPRKGYRFIAEVIEEPKESEVKALVDQPKPSIRSPRRYHTFVLFFSAVAILCSMFWLIYRPNTHASESILFQPYAAERLSSTGNAMVVGISPNGKYVAYTDQTNGKWSVWLRHLSTGENIPIIPSSDVFFGGLTFSRDGEYIYFVRNENFQSSDIYRVNTFGGIPVKLIEDAHGWISISPDDKKISFVRCKRLPEDNCSLFIADIDGSNEQKLVTRPVPIRLADNQFSPDGRSIAFTSGQSATGSNDFGLYMFDLETGEESMVTSHRWFNIHSLVWLPYGQNIVFTARDRLFMNFSIWTISTSTGAVEQLTRDDGNFSRLSLDDAGTMMLTTKVDNTFGVYIEEIGVIGSRRHLAVGNYAVFAADGSRVVYESKDSDVWMINPDGSGKRQLTSDPLSDFSPIVSRDGSHIFFSSNRSGMTQLWRMNIDGSDQRQITKHEGGYAIVVSPDKEHVYYRTGTTEAIRSVTFDGTRESAVQGLDKRLKAISPDGKLVVEAVADKQKMRRSKLVIKSLSDNLQFDEIEIVDERADRVPVAWGDDSRSLYYVINEADKFSLMQYQLNTKTSVRTANLGTERVMSLSVSPDGRSIVTVRGQWTHDAYLVTGLRR